MAQLPGRLGVLQTILSAGLVPNLYTADAIVLRKAAEACVEGGCPVLEVTNRGDGAIDMFRALVEWAARTHPTLLLGAGTITEAQTAAAYINAGARFVVAPNFNPEVASVCNRRGVLYVPGCATPSEISDALAAGALLIKLFPAAPLGGPEYLRAVLGPLPQALVMPSGGITTDEESLGAWFAAGAACVSIGSNLFPPAGAREGGAASGTVAEVVTAIRRVRS